MTASAATTGTWDKVEKIASLCLQIVLVAFIGSRLLFAVWWPMPTLDFSLSAIALALVVASFWLPARNSRWRLAIIALATASQVVPMLVREPILLFPVLGGLIPVAILVGSLVALSKKGPRPRPPTRSC